VEGRLAKLRALEALRNGVPNSAAVTLLPSGQQHIEDRFAAALNEASAPAVIFTGGFGTGKSHLLSHLEQVALGRCFVCSRVAIGKEAPLHDVSKLFGAMVSGMTVPDGIGPPVQLLVERLAPNSEAFKHFYRQVVAPGSAVPEFLQASLTVFERGTPELQDAMADLWAGGKLSVPEMKAALRAIGATGAFEVRGVPAPVLAVARFGFLAGLIKAAGYKGWVLLIDELELVGRYSNLQRAKAYATLYLLAGQHPQRVFAAAAGAVTEDFSDLILGDTLPGSKADLEELPRRLVERGAAHAATVPSVRAGMALLHDPALRITRPSRAEIGRTTSALAALYAEAYGWTPPPPEQPDTADVLQTRRFHIRKHIGQWDLMRLYPGEEIAIEARDIDFGYAEDEGLDDSGEDEDER
jgi:hypothetical protein